MSKIDYFSSSKIRKVNFTNLLGFFHIFNQLIIYFIPFLLIFKNYLKNNYINI